VDGDRRRFQRRKDSRELRVILPECLQSGREVLRESRKIASKKKIHRKCLSTAPEEKGESLPKQVTKKEGTIRQKKSCKKVSRKGVPRGKGRSQKKVLDIGEKSQKHGGTDPGERRKTSYSTKTIYNNRSSFRLPPRGGRKTGEEELKKRNTGKRNRKACFPLFQKKDLGATSRNPFKRDLRKKIKLGRKGKSGE